MTGQLFSKPLLALWLERSQINLGTDLVLDLPSLSVPNGQRPISPSNRNQTDSLMLTPTRLSQQSFKSSGCTVERSYQSRMECGIRSIQAGSEGLD